ncbi:MAG: RimK family alpha-L-glutamate ligase [Proteobacteria bacterium]|nr:RimK family alpha-L-glutamate ligase [Pseudomonadota bacterium]NOG59232.1 RimK family alpha-L-glutamate ligase [Pseudomonadota bacterium]
MDELQRKVAIVTDDPGWHGRQLVAALKDHGLDSQYLSLTDCTIEIGGNGQELHFPGFEQIPFAFFIRGVPGGTLEQVIFRLDILHALHDSGITVYNTPRAIERTVDKPLTSLLLSRAGLPTPTTWICESIDKAEAILDKETRDGHKLVLKPLFGSQGIGVHLVDKQSGLIHDENFAGIYYLQRFIERKNNEFTDIRVLVIDGIAKAAMLRRGVDWITNRAQGASCEAIKLDANIATLAESACKVLDIDYAGVDLMQDKQGQFYIIEVNSIPAWYGLQNVVDFNIASCLIDSFVKRIADYNQLKVCSN